MATIRTPYGSSWVNRFRDCQRGVAGSFISPRVLKMVTSLIADAVVPIWDRALLHALHDAVAGAVMDVAALLPVRQAGELPCVQCLSVSV